MHPAQNLQLSNIAESIFQMQQYIWLHHCLIKNKMSL